MFDALLEFVGGSAWAYAAIFAIVTVDAFFPLVPGETSVITGAILAANDELSVLLVFAAAMAGALAATTSPTCSAIAWDRPFSSGCSGERRRRGSSSGRAASCRSAGR